MYKRIGLAMAAAGALYASPLNATTTYCYTSGGFSACASAAITVNNGLTQLSIAIQNLSNQVGNTVYAISSFGLYYITPPAYTGTITLASGAPNWINGVPGSLYTPGPVLSAGQTLHVVGGARANVTAGPNTPQRVSNFGLVGCGPLPNTNPSVISTCNAPITFVFTLSNTSNFSLNNLNFSLRGVAWTDLNSSTSEPDFFNCHSTNRNCVTVTPEPATMGLLAIGLIGVGGVGLARRRRRRKPAD